MKDRVYVVCSGPSMKGFDFNRLATEDTIVVNLAYKYVPEWKYMVAIDACVFDTMKETQGDASWNKDRVIYTRDYFDNGHKIPYHIKSNEQYLHILRMRDSNNVLEDRHGLLCCRNNSGYMAVSMAMRLGYRDIRILGMDLGGTHFYDDVAFDYTSTIKHMATLEKALLTRDITIYRYDNGSWEGFKKLSIEEILK